MARKSRTAGTSKYNNRRINTHYGKFHSCDEFCRYLDLVEQQEQGKINGLVRQISFSLIPSQMNANGESLGGTSYKSDFCYFLDGKYVVEDFKGLETDVFKIKEKLLLKVHGITLLKTHRADIDQRFREMFKGVGKMVNEEAYMVIRGWMVSELHLSGNELLAYSLIFNFSKGGADEYKGGVEYAMEWLGCSKPTAIKVMANLVGKGLVEKREVATKTGRACYYRAVRDGKKTLPGVVKNFNGGGKESLPKNIKGNYKYKNSRSAQTYNKFMSNEYDYDALEKELLK